MPKLILDLVEGGSISLERQGEFLVVSNIKDNKETVLGLLRRADFPHLRSFMENEMFISATTQVARSVPPFEDATGDFVRKLVREFKKEMDRDPDEPEASEGD